MRILQISTADRGGGAENVGWNLFQAYQERGHRSWLAVGRKRTSNPDVYQLQHNPQPLSFGAACGSTASFFERLEGRIRGASRARVLLRQLQRGWRTPLDQRLGHEDYNFPGTRSVLSITGEDPDIVHAHNLHGNYFDLRMLPKIASERPLILTVHDGWLLSGHCAHSFQCDRWMTGCGQCPDLEIYPSIRRDATAWNWRRKRRIFARTKLYVASPSKWLMNRVEQSILAPAVLEARVIPNGVDLAVFRPATDRLAVRRKLGIDLDARVLVFAANGIRHNRFKDYDTLRSAIKALATDWNRCPLFLYALGDDGPAQQIGSLRIEPVPFLSNQRDLVEYLQAADVYVHPARVETFPSAVLEAMACGAPVIASAVGGILEQIDAETGMLVPMADVRALANAIRSLLDNDELRERLGAAGRNIAQQRYDLNLQVDRYLSWYDQIVSESRAPKAKSAGGPSFIS